MKFNISAKKILLHKNLIGSIVIFSLIFLAYIPYVFHLSYVWDDISMFIMNPALRVKSMAWQAIWKPIFQESSYFRPLVMATLALQFTTLGLSAAIAHSVNLMLLCINSVLVYQLALYFNDTEGESGYWRPILAALIYGLHPALIESTSWVVGRFDEMATLFILIGQLIYLKNYYNDKINIFLVCLSFFLAALCKEEAIVFPILIFLFEIYKNQKKSIRTIIAAQLSPPLLKLYIALLTTGLGYLLLRSQFVSGRFINNPGFFNHTLTHMAYVGETLWIYFKISIFPFGYFGSIHTSTLLNFGWIDYITGFLSLAACLILIFTTLLKRTTSLILGTLWLTALLPVSNIIPLTINNNMAQDRFLTLPLVFFSIALSRLHVPSQLNAHLSRLNKAPQILAVIWLALSIITVRMTIPLWTNNFTLWSWAMKENPKDIFVQYNYIGACLQYRKLKQAEAFFSQHPHDGSAEIRTVHGVLLIEQGKIREGIDILRDVEQKTPRSYTKLIALHVNIANAHAVSNAGGLWFYQYLYTQLADAYLLQNNYNQAYHYSIIATFYSYRFPAAWAARSFAAYGTNHWIDGNTSHQKFLQYTVNLGRTTAINARIEFLNNLCKQTPLKTPQVCLAWHAEKTQQQHQ